MSGAEVRLAWGSDGVRALAPGCSALIVVDVLSFSTAVDVATSTGARVLPLRWHDERAGIAAGQAGAVLARPRSDTEWSLSPSSLLTLTPEVLLALPSPNGATLCAEAAEFGVNVFAGCLRNAMAVAAAAGRLGGPIGVVAAGEGHRPAVEDAIGAGAIIAALSGPRSAEAEFVAAGYQAVSQRIKALLAECVSGRELRDGGFAHDVALAAEVDTSMTAPVLRGGRFEAS
ncbi:2-phosphosulfolactate phosphatase [Saccharopolyspora erythraea]|uniref:2-phosphosulfolactate phosphatase n=1 Tax=Saccharopolyspora erythraea TaxID=1836 RepID=UPI001BADCED1|nr:2-phosphosulfolactate phosphatase [Saccharopolyspora erythraea]QUH00957.1 2-phosphosulfolactate phosphatase [Saccharopolyspora erythraea]